MSAFSQNTEEAQLGGVGEDVMLDHEGSPERDREVTDQFLATAALHIREPRIYISPPPKQAGWVDEVTEEARSSTYHKLLLCCGHGWCPSGKGSQSSSE